MIALDDTRELDALRHVMNDRVWREAPVEKARAIVRQAEMARIMEKCGSMKMNGIGQKIGSIDARTFFRWQQQYPGCWQDPDFIRVMLRDNDALRAPGYKPVHRLTQTKKV